jgi:chromosome segregation ATPase
MVDGARNFTYNKAVAYKKYLLQNKLTEAEKVLARQQSELATLVKDQNRYAEGIEKNRQKGTRAATDKVQAEAALESNKQAVQAKQSEISGHTERGGAKALQDLMKEQAEAQDRIERLGTDA